MLYLQNPFPVILELGLYTIILYIVNMHLYFIMDWAAQVFFTFKMQR